MNNEPAFPEHDVNGYDHPGLTKLEYAAIMVMQAQTQALTAFSYTMKSPSAAQCEWLTQEITDSPRAAIALAKALLAALEKEQSNGK